MPIPPAIITTDIGTFAAVAFKDPGNYIGKAIYIAGVELTGPQMTEILGGVLERTLKYRQIPIEKIRSFSLDYALIMEWFNAYGYEADIPALRKTRPAFMTFDKWALAAEHAHA